jgi:hypothetical protein
MIEVTENFCNACGKQGPDFSLFRNVEPVTDTLAISSQVHLMAE